MLVSHFHPRYQPPRFLDIRRSSVLLLARVCLSCGLPSTSSHAGCRNPTSRYSSHPSLARSIRPTEKVRRTEERAVSPKVGCCIWGEGYILRIRNYTTTPPRLYSRCSLRRAIPARLALNPSHQSEVTHRPGDFRTTLSNLPPHCTSYYLRSDTPQLAVYRSLPVKMLSVQSPQGPPAGNPDGNGDIKQPKPKTLPCKYCNKWFRLVTPISL